MADSASIKRSYYGEDGEGESIKGIDYVNIVAHAHVHLLHPCLNM